MATNLGCALNEGFASFVAVALWGGDVDYASDIANGRFYPGRSGSNVNDGSIIEGAVASFFYDVVDGGELEAAFEPFDEVKMPVAFVGDVLRTCSVFHKSWGYTVDTGIDHVTYCMERQVDQGLYAQGFFRTRNSNNYSSVLVQSARVSQIGIRNLWRKNLYGLDPAPPTNNPTNPSDPGEPCEPLPGQFDCVVD